MPLLALYIIKLSISLMIVYLFYALVLRRLTFYNWNRWYLLGYSLLAFVIPFINISSLLQLTQWHEHNIVQLIPVVDSYTIIDPANLEMIPGRAYTYWDFLLPALLAGIVLLLLRLLIQYWSYRRLHRSAQLVVNNTVKIYQVDQPIIPFSFGNSIFINRRQYGEDELEKIIRHEFVHVMQKHTVDVLLSELVCILNWYNPFAWLIRKSIRQNLEFIADSEVLQNGINKKQYQYLLLRVMGDTQFSFTNQFNIISLKKRIVMMNKIKSAKLHLVKFLFVLPLLATMLLAFRSIAIDNTSAGTIDVQDILSMNKASRESQPVAETPVTVSSNVPARTIPAAAADTQTLPNIIAHLKAPGDPYKHRTDTAPAPLIIIDGVIQPKGTNAMNRVDAGDIESIDVLKDAQATSVYGEAGKRGVILITTKAGVSKKVKENKANNFITDRLSHRPLPLYIVDGKECDQADVEKLPADPNNIESITILKDSSAASVYGEKGKHGVILITTKTGASRKELENGQDSGLIKHMLNCHPPQLIIVEGREYDRSDFDKNQLDVNTIESVEVLKGSRATDIYGEKGKHGVIIIKLKKEITQKAKPVQDLFTSSR